VKGERLALVLFLFFSQLPGSYANLINLGLPGEMDGVKMDICNPEKCLFITTPRIVVGSIDRNFSFTHAVVSLKIKQSSKIDFVVEADDAYWDEASSLLFLRKLKAPYNKQEVLINVTKLEVHFSAIK